MIGFRGRVAIVTGAGGTPGLGRAFALLLAQRGARVLVNDVRMGSETEEQGAAVVAAEIRRAGAQAISNGDSVATRDGAQAIVDAAVQAWGRVDILIPNAGVAPNAPFHEITDADLQKVVDTHLMGHIWLIRAAWPMLLEQGYGRIVNISSQHAVTGSANHTTYAAAKLGIVGLTRSLATEGTARGIRVNAVMPSAATIGRQESARVTAGRTGAPPVLLSDESSAESVAPVVALLASEKCPVSGVTLEAERGAVREMFMSWTHGSNRDPSLSIETLHASLADVFDRRGASAIEPSGGVSFSLSRRRDAAGPSQDLPAM